MQGLIERIGHKVKKFAKKTLWVVVGLIPLFIIASDFDKPGEGNIRLVFHWVLSMIIAGYTNAVEIANTPLVALTIAKIVGLIFYAVIGIILLGIGKGILFWWIKGLFCFGESE